MQILKKKKTLKAKYHKGLKLKDIYYLLCTFRMVPRPTDVHKLWLTFHAPRIQSTVPLPPGEPA